MKKVLCAALLIAVVGCQTTTSTTTPTATSGPATSAPPSNDSLYRRLGGYDAIAAVTDDFIGRMIADKQLGRYFVGLSQGSRETLREHVIELLCYTAKGPCLYVGRDLGEAHTGLNISDSDWKVAMKHLDATLNKFNVPSREHQELVGAIENFKEDIVGK